MTIVTTDNESAGDTFCSSQLYVDWFDLSVIIKIMMSQVVQGKWFFIGSHQQVQNADCQRVNWGQHATVNKQMSLSVSCP